MPQPKDPAGKAGQQAPEAPETQNLSEILEAAYDASFEAEDAETEATAETQDPVEDGQSVVEPPEETDEPQYAEDDHEEETAETETETESEYNEPPPDRWPDHIKKAYQALPSEAKRVMMEDVFKPMQRAHTKATQDLAQQRKQFEPLLEAFERNKDAFARVGATDPTPLIERQLAWAAHFAQVGPEQGLRDMQQALGLREDTEGHRSSEDAHPYLTPTEKRMQQRLEQQEQELQRLKTSTMEQQQTAQQRAQQQARFNAARQELQAFAAETTPDGQPAHPHVPQVAETMGRLLQTGMVARKDQYGQPRPFREQLNDAYGMALRLSPDAQRQQARQQRSRGDSEQAARVAAASRDVNPKAPAAEQVPVDRPIHDDISDLYDRMAGGRR